MAMDPAAMPQEAPAPEGAPQEGGGGNDVMDLITNISEGLAMLVDAASEVSPEVSQALQKINDDYKAVIEQLTASQGQDPAAAAQAPGMSPAGGMPEAAGAKGAVPVGAPPKGAIPVGRR